MGLPMQTQQTAVQKIKMLPTMERLIVEYLALSAARGIRTNGEAGELADELDWKPLANQIRIHESDVQALWDHIGEERRQGLWALAVQHRIETTFRAPGIQLHTRERVVGKAIEKLEAMLDQGLIRDVSELLSVAKVLGSSAGPSNPGANQTPSMTFNIGGGQMRMQDGETLPGGDDVIHINLTPRAARSVEESTSVANMRNVAERVIDAEMLGVESLRSLAFPKRDDEE